MERSEFFAHATRALEHLDEHLGEIDVDDFDVNLAGDVLTLTFGDKSQYIINAHSAALQIWMAAERNAWHFDHTDAGWVAAKTGDELNATVKRVVGEKLGVAVEL